MRDLMTLLPIFVFMLIPVWIPLIAMTFGALYDAVSSPAKAARRTETTPVLVAAPKHVDPAQHVAPAAAAA